MVATGRGPLEKAKDAVTWISVKRLGKLHDVLDDNRLMCNTLHELVLL